MLYSNKSTRVIILILCLLFLIKYCNAGGELRLAGARSASMGNSSIALTDIWAAFNNQAALTGIASPTAGLFIENRFMLKELGYMAAAYAYPYKSGIIAANFSQFGFEAWKENKVALSYTNSLYDHLALGVQLDYIMIHRDENFGDLHYITFEFGILSKINKQVTLGAHFYNPLNREISKTTNERSPSVLRLGGAYNVTKEFLLTAEVEKDIQQKVGFKCGMEYKLIPALHVRAGICSNPSTFCFGVGIFYRKLTMDFSSCYHQILGFTPQTSLTITF